MIFAEPQAILLRPISKDVYLICLDGAPCAGKSTAKKRIVEFGRENGFTVIFVPEIARMFLDSGMQIGQLIDSENPEIMDEFQSLMSEFQSVLENFMARLGALHPTEKVLLVTDRGGASGRAYLDPAQHDAIMHTMGTSIREQRDRYIAILFLTTAAIGAEEYYVQDEVRWESIEQAQALHWKSLGAWTGCERLRIIGNTDTDGVQITFDQKMDWLIRELAHVIGVPAPLEIERKFLLRPAVLEALMDSSLTVVANDITQNYLITNDGTEHRVRATKMPGHATFAPDTHFTETTKTEVPREDHPGLVREEREHSISATEYRRLLKDRDPSLATIEKTRHSFPWGTQYFQLDEITCPPGMDSDLVVVEVELSREDADVLFPPQIEPFVLREVTEDLRYRNQAIAAGKCPGYTAE